MELSYSVRKILWNVYGLGCAWIHQFKKFWTYCKNILFQSRLVYLLHLLENKPPSNTNRTLTLRKVITFKKNFLSRTPIPSAAQKARMQATSKRPQCEPRQKDPNASRHGHFQISRVYVATTTSNRLMTEHSQ